MTVADAIFRQKRVSLRIGHLAAPRRVSRIPVQHEGSRLPFREKVRCFRSGAGVARDFVFEQKITPFLPALCGIKHFPFMAARYGSGSSSRQKSKPRTRSDWKAFASSMRARDLVLLLESEIGAELRPLGANSISARPANPL